MTSARGNEYPIPETMKAWVLGDPEQLSLVDKKVPEPGPAEVLVRIDAIAVCATDIEVIKHGVPAMIDGGLPFNKGFTPGHEYMGTVVKLGPTVDEFAVGDRVAVEIHAGCGRCPRCREGMYTSCLNYGYRAKGHRANGFSTDGGFAEYAINNVNTMVHIPDSIGDAEATLIVTAGTAMYGLDVMGGVIAGEAVVVIGPGPIGLMGVRRRQGLGRPAGDPHRHARQPPRHGHETGRRSCRQCRPRGSGRCGDAPHRRQRGELRARMLGRA
jgi:L-iditol 2-dehydrogenase